MILIMFIISLIIAFILIILNSILGEKNMFSREMNSAFECGFDPKSMSRLPFSLHFFLVALIFLIFDVEITLLIPIPLVLEKSILSSVQLMYSFFVMILLWGLFIEWKNGALDWTS